MGERARSASLWQSPFPCASVLPGVKYEKIEGNKLEVTMPDGRERRLEADTFIVAAGSKPRQDLHSELKRTVPEVHLNGDVAEPRNVRAAIAEGWKAGNEI